MNPLSRLLFLTLIILLTKGVSAQILTIDYVTSWIELESTNSNPAVMWVIDGVPVVPEEFNKTLNEYGLEKDKVSIEVLGPKALESLYINRRLDALVAIRTHNTQLRKKHILNHLKEFRKRIPEPSIKTHHINNTLKPPVLVIDGIPIHHNEAAKVLANLKTRDIFNMAYTSKAPIKYYGQNAKNGLIQIWLKEKK